MIRVTSVNPSFAPSTKASYTGTRLNTPYSGNPTITATMTNVLRSWMASLIACTRHLRCFRLLFQRRDQVGIGPPVRRQLAEQDRRDNPHRPPERADDPDRQQQF